MFLPLNSENIKKMKFQQALNEAQILTESFPRYKLEYVGTRKDYKIHDPFPYVLAIDKKYNVDGNGLSLLGMNLHYFKGDVPALVNDINDKDNKAGFRGFDFITGIREKFSKDKEEFKKWEADKRKKRYRNLIDEFPFLAKIIRRYKIKGPDGKPGVVNQKRAILK